MLCDEQRRLVLIFVYTDQNVMVVVVRWNGVSLSTVCLSVRSARVHSRACDRPVPIIKNVFGLVIFLVAASGSFCIVILSVLCALKFMVTSALKRKPSSAPHTMGNHVTGNSFGELLGTDILPQQVLLVPYFSAGTAALH